jgi:L-ascorbate metabolism protein UlaG (beta-lactamase superfamily)
MKLIVAFFLVTTILTSINAQPGNPEVTYLGNCGFLISVNEKQVLIDALFNRGFDFYLTPADTIVAKIYQRQAPFAHANLLLITHDHPDHFDAQMVAAYLGANPENRVVAPSLVINSIRSQSGLPVPEKQLIEIPLHTRPGIDTTVQGIRIISYYLQHDNRPNIQNVGYLIEVEGIKVFHSGDNTGAVKAEFELMQFHNKGIDLAMLNFYGFWGSNEERDFTKSLINPGNIVLMHIPPKEFDVVKDSCDKIQDFIDIKVFRSSMERKLFIYN